MDGNVLESKHLVKVTILHKQNQHQACPLAFAHASQELGVAQRQVAGPQ